MRKRIENGQTKRGSSRIGSRCRMALQQHNHCVSGLECGPNSYESIQNCVLDIPVASLVGSSRVRVFGIEGRSPVVAKTTTQLMMAQLMRTQNGLSDQR